MKKILFILFGLFSLHFYHAQNVGINATSSAPDNSAGLDIDFSDKGILIPRVSLDSIDDILTIPNPKTGLLVFNINPAMQNGAIGFWYYNSTHPLGAQWIHLAESSGQCVGLSISLQASSPQICQGQSTTLTASGALTYTWSHGLGTGSSKTVSPNSTTTYTVTGTDGAGCTSTQTFTVVVNSAPNVSLSASPGTTINNGSSVTISASGANSYSWSNGLGTGNSKTVSPNSTTTYTVTGTSNGCTDVETITITVNPSLQVGDFHQGGIVFKVSGTYPNQHGLIVSVAEQSYGMKWGHYGTVTGANSGFDGATNTSTIVSYGGTSAAITAANYSYGGYNDWYLPSRWELKDLYNNMATVNSGLMANGFYSTIAAQAYWSSTEALGANAANWAWVVQFANGADGENLKDSPALRRVRAIRAF